jgi:enoyl-CoA hydratase/carnithine racemase
MLQLEIADGFARIRFDQPGSRANVLSSAMWAALGDAVASVAGRTDLRGLILTSAKDGIFLAGADLKELYALPENDEGPARQVVKAGHDVLNALEQLPMPTAAVVDGACLGGGLEVALACDLRFAGSHPKCKFGLPEVKLGLIPGWGGTQRLARLIGLATAAELLVTGRSMTAEEAVAAGLVEARPAGDPLEQAAVGRLASLSPDDWSELRARKQRPAPAADLNRVHGLLAGLPEDERVAAQTALQVAALGNRLPLAMGCRVEAEAFVPLLASPNARARMAAFLKK